ncbi:hypothetical protein GQ55_5G476300 [Panicum hallii var. hallii]|uniref:Flotillin-like n=1 Tax=Panicum hallii var. hallii TaxID=1504633 RepID=A0A2T7DQY7_9POAL|nr:hypothetical protein GQ55_5G476300 [Panicum hallii var. hallii]
MASLEVADASEYLAITGRGLDDVKLAKKASEQGKKFDTTPPVNYEFEVHATTSEKLSLVLPVVFTVGPKVDEHTSHSNKASQLLYSKLIIAPHDNGSSHVRELVKGAVEGQARALAASMTTEEIFQGAEAFEQAVLEKVQLELDRFGLFIYSANVVNKQLVDVHKVGVHTTKAEAEAEALDQNERDAVVAAAKADLATKMPWVLGLFIASAAVTLVVYEAPPGVDKGAYYLAVSGAFFAAVAGIMAAVLAAN